MLYSPNLWIRTPTKPAECSEEGNLGHRPVAHQRVGFADPESGHGFVPHGAIVGLWCCCRRGTIIALVELMFFFGGFHSHGNGGTQKWMLYKGKSYFRKPPHIAFDFNGKKQCEKT